MDIFKLTDTYLFVGELLRGVEPGLSPGWSLYVDDDLEDVQSLRDDPRHRYNLEQHVNRHDYQSQHL